MSLFTSKTLLITGGTGSFGNAVLNRFLKTDIGEIRVFSRDENIDREMLLFKHQIKIEIDQFVERINNLIEQFEENIKIKR